MDYSTFLGYKEIIGERGSRAISESVAITVPLINQQQPPVPRIEMASFRFPFSVSGEGNRKCPRAGSWGRGGGGRLVTDIEIKYLFVLLLQFQLIEWLIS